MPAEPPAPGAPTSAGVRVAGGLFSAGAAALVLGRAAGYVPFSWLEIFGAVTGAACVLLVVARSAWNFPLGIASCLAYLVFFAEGKLYADAGLQLVFVALGAHGWVAWSRGREERNAREGTRLAVLSPESSKSLAELLAQLDERAWARGDQPMGAEEIERVAERVVQEGL